VSSELKKTTLKTKERPWKQAGSDQGREGGRKEREKEREQDEQSLIFIFVLIIVRTDFRRRGRGGRRGRWPARQLVFYDVEGSTIVGKCQITKVEISTRVLDVNRLRRDGGHAINMITDIRQDEAGKAMELILDEYKLTRLGPLREVSGR